MLGLPDEAAFIPLRWVSVDPAVLLPRGVPDDSTCYCMINSPQPKGGGLVHTEASHMHMLIPITLAVCSQRACVLCVRAVLCVLFGGSQLAWSRGPCMAHLYSILYSSLRQMFLQH
jgi:hypothetical protein